MKATREEVYRAIDGERNYQDLLRQPGAKFGTNDPADSGPYCVGEHLTMLRVYINRADQAWTDNSGVEASLDVIRKIAAIAVHCMEDNGVVFR